MKAILDDLRDAENINEILRERYGIQENIVFDVVWRDMDEAVNWINLNGCPQFIAFDHDLGCRNPIHASYGSFCKCIDMMKPSGYDFAKWLCEKDLENPGFIPNDFEFMVQSANMAGANNIMFYLKGYLRHRRNNR